MPFKRPALIDAYKRVSNAIHELNTAWAVFYSRMSTDALHYYVNTEGNDDCFADDGLLEAWFEGYCDENGIVVDEGFEDSGYVVRKEHPDDLIIHRNEYNRVLSYFIELVHLTQRNVSDK